jgi:hypothetical protein
VDLRGLANTVSNAVNPNVIVTVTASTGYTIGSAGRQTPSYATPVTGPAQLQALDGSELKKLDGLNIQGVIRAIYLRGPLAGVIRPNSKGGDLVTIAAPAPAELIGTWLVVKVLESWPLWTKCAIWLQVAA